MDKKKILLIDDEPDLCFLVKRGLEDTGEFTVQTSSSGAKGIDLARKEKPDLVLLDVMMPDMQGDAVAERLAEYAETRDIPVIFLTAIVLQEEIGAGAMRIIGGRRYIAKPISKEKLALCIHEVLESSEVPV